MPRFPLIRPLLVVLSVLLVVACAVNSGPLKLYFISSSRFTSGSKTIATPGDTLSTRLYAATGAGGSSRLKHFRVTATYSPLTAPFAYPPNLATFSYTSLPTSQEVVYLDSTLTTAPTDFLYTSTFNARTTSGSETWLFTATDTEDNTSARSFTLAVRRPDSTLVYHDYTLNLPASAYGSAARRFIDLKTGLVYPAYSLTGITPSSSLQKQTDLILLPNAARLVAPADPSITLNTRWPTANRQRTLFNLTMLTATTFADVKDTLSIQQQFVARSATTQLTNLIVGQVYAFHTYDLSATSPNVKKPVYGLMRVVSLPAGSTAGLQFQVRLAKQPR